MNAFYNLIEPWLLSDDSDDLILLRDQVTWLQKELFDEYEPSHYDTFDERLAKWLLNVDDRPSQIRLFRLIKHLFFVGKKQLDGLARSAYNDQIRRWIVDINNFDISDPDIDSLISDAVGNTWFCPITDSLRINGFLKVIGLSGHSHRPDWWSLKKFAGPCRIQQYIRQNNIQQLVLIEDFVGTGTQMRNTVRWAAKNIKNIPILVVPLICCPAGERTGIRLESELTNVSFAPCLSLQPGIFLTEIPHLDEPPEFSEVRPIIQRVQARLGDFRADPYGYCGTGALVAMYSNCPDNTLPIIHVYSREWNPLFLRVARE